MNDATQPGVSPKHPDQIKEEQEAAVREARQATIQERVSEVQDLAEMHKARRAADLADQPSDEPAPTPPASEDPTPAPPANDPPVKVDTDQQNTEDMVTLVIDGEEKAVPRSKVIEAGQRTLQKEYSADQRLEEATRVLNEAKATAESLTKPASQPSSSQQDVDDTSADSVTDVRELAKTLVDGDVDEVAETLDKLGIGRQQATQVQQMDPNAVYGMVEGALQIKDAQDLFRRDPESGGYGDLYADETMRRMVLDKETELFNQDRSKPPVERLKQAADSVREWRDGLVKKAGGSVVDFSSRADKKNLANSTPETGGGRMPSVENERPKSQADKRREALAKMARSRGQDID